MSGSRRAALIAAGLASAVLLAATGCDFQRSPAHRPAANQPASALPDAVDGAGAAAGLAANPFTDRVPLFPPVPPAEPVIAPGGDSAPVYLRLPVHQPVAFLTIDDGLTRAPEDIALVRAANVPITLFPIAPVAVSAAPFFRELQQLGAVIEDHTVDHRSLRGTGYGYQHEQICAAADALGGTFGRRPLLFRPPYGEYDPETLRAAHDCGLRAVVHWSETVNQGKVRYQGTTHRVQPGDVILMHFRPAFVADLLAALAAIRAAGLTPALLEQYLT